MPLDLSTFSCPTCGKKLDAATSADGSDIAPSEGDLSICFGCGEILKFGVSGFALLGEELLTLPSNIQEQLTAYSNAFKYRRKCLLPSSG